MSIFKKDAETSGEESSPGGKSADKPEKNNVKGSKSPSSLEQNADKFKQTFGGSGDVIINYVKGGGEDCLSICANIYILGLSDGDTINFLATEINKILGDNEDLSFESLFTRLSSFRSTKKGLDFNSACQELLLGNTVFIDGGSETYYSIATNSNNGRSISEPTSQTIIKGPKDAFTENINTNIFLIRKRIRNTALRIENLTIGNVTHTNVRLMYIDGIAKEEILNDVRGRLQKINIDCILDSNYIEEMIKTSRYSIFPTSLNSEKPDSVSAALLEGRIAIVVDGSPYIITVPALMVEFLQASEDYYHHYVISSFMRILRYVAFYLTMLVPALFVTITTFHQEIIPAPLLINIAAQREGVPFPAFFEVLLLEFTFEVLREAGIRMPRAVGSAISIVGALVLGQAAVEAGLISAAVVIVVSITAIASFVITNYAMSSAVRLLRFVFIFLAGAFGIYGVTMGMIILCLHLCNLKTASVPYLMPFAPVSKSGKKDGTVRSPLWSMKDRPEGISDDKHPRTDGQPAVSPSIKERQEFL